MAIKWTKQDVIQKFQEAMEPSLNPGPEFRLPAPEKGQATLRKLLSFKQYIPGGGLTRGGLGGSNDQVE